MTNHEVALSEINRIKEHALNMRVKTNSDSEFIEGLNWAFDSIISYCERMIEIENEHPYAD